MDSGTPWHGFYLRPEIMRPTNLIMLPFAAEPWMMRYCLSLLNVWPSLLEGVASLLGWLLLLTLSLSGIKYRGSSWHWT
jgi:hypothetical protein